MQSQIEDRVVPHAIEPDAAADVTVAHAHRHQSHVNSASVEPQLSGDNLAFTAYGDWAQRIRLAVLTG